MEEKLRGVSWKEYKVGELFEELKITNKLNKSHICSGGTTPIYSSDTTNNGIVGYCVEQPTYKVAPKTKMYLVFGDHTRSMNIVETDFCVADNVKVLKPKVVSKKVLLYIMAVWYKQIPMLGYARHWTVAKSVSLPLPTTPAGEIDYDFMESFIAQLEAERLAQLEAYLGVTGLKNCELSEEEERVLSEPKVYKEYKLGELFEKVKVKSLKYKAGDLPNKAEAGYTLPAVTASTTNQGLSKYVPKEEATVLKNSITIASNGAAGTTYYQDKEFTILQDAYAIRLILEDMNKGVGLYLAGAISVALLGRYDWANKATWERVQKDIIYLPTTSTGEIDYEYMETYIKAVEKLAIKSVVGYADERIEKTKQVVGKK